MSPIQLPIYVIGDSHTRAYSFNDNFLPTFAGAGKENCFITDETAAHLKKNIVNAIERFQTENPILLFLGEPDTRYYLGKGWYPWKSEIKEDISGMESNVFSSIKRYEELVSVLTNTFRNRFIIHCVTPCRRRSQNKITDRFNEELEKICNKFGLLFLKINERIYINDEKIIDDKYYSDEVHLNNKIQVLAEDILKRHGLIERSGFAENISWSNEEMIKKFKFDEKFGCYIMKEENQKETVGFDPGKITLNAASFLSSEAKTIDILKKFGVAIIPGFYQAEATCNLNSEFDRILENKEPWVKKMDYSNGSAVSVWKKDLEAAVYPETHNTFSAPFMERITKAYLGEKVRSNIGIYFVKDVVGTKHHANDLHFDVERSLKFFIYLNDTTAENGAFFCAPSTNLRAAEMRKKWGDKVSYDNRELSRDLPVKEEEVIPIEGEAGSLIIFDTDVFHRAGFVHKGERRVMRGFSDIVSVPHSVKKENPSFFRRIFNKLKG